MVTGSGVKMQDKPRQCYLLYGSPAAKCKVLPCAAPAGMEGSAVLKRTLLCAALLTALSTAVPVSLPAVPQCSGTGCPHGLRRPPRQLRQHSRESTAAPSAAPTFPQTITLHDEASDSDFTISAVDFMVGAAACEMPATWPDDALLAQMVASRSYALYLSAQGQSFTANSCFVQRLDQQRGSAKPLGQ